MNSTNHTSTTEQHQHGDPVELYGPDDQKLNLSALTDRGAGAKNPFDSSFLDGASRMLATHGPAFAKLSLIVGSATATVYNAIKAGASPRVLNGDLITTVLIAAGLIVECGFAYAWSRKGSYDLAGAQRITADAIFNRASLIMIGDLSLSVAEIAFGVGMIAIYWVGIVQPIFAVHIVRLFYRLKGEHPEYIAEMEIVDLRADLRAADIRDKADALRLSLAERKHERHMQWAALDARHYSGSKLVTSRWFKRQVNNAVKEAVGKSLLGDIRARVGKLPKLLRIGGAQKS